VSDVTFSVIVPTRGRKSISSALASITEQLEPGDEIIVRCSRDLDFGNRARQSMVERAKGTHLLFMDDDDQFAREALATMRAFAREHPGRIGIFRMRYLDGRVLWTEPELRRRNVSSQMFCVPNVPGKVGKWTNVEPGKRMGDYEFIAESVALQGEPIFREEVVAHIRTDRRPVRRAVDRVLAPLAELRYRSAPLTRLRRLRAR
jgi:glycosyltransferase involved in cell wall biosynthesis